jgi:hypothetical protein
VSVYFITCRDAGAVKIGHSVDPHGRLPEVQLGCPLPLKVEAWVLGGREEEMAMHWRFSEHRIHGEWFHLCDEIELVITGNPAPAPPQRGPKGGIARRAAVSMTVRILIGDCRERLRELPDASVHCCVTSPPYFGLRDYGCEGQMGLEPTPDEFVAGMVEVFREVRRVLRDDGTLWLNIGDSYAGSWGARGRARGRRRSAEATPKAPARHDAPPRRAARAASRKT